MKHQKTIIAAIETTVNDRICGTDYVTVNSFLKDSFPTGIKIELSRCTGFVTSTMSEFLKDNLAVLMVTFPCSVYSCGVGVVNPRA